jgi:hypothetical protein
MCARSLDGAFNVLQLCFGRQNERFANLKVDKQSGNGVGRHGFLQWFHTAKSGAGQQAHLAKRCCLKRTFDISIKRCQRIVNAEARGGLRIAYAHTLLPRRIERNRTAAP